MAEKTDKKPKAPKSLKTMAAIKPRLYNLEGGQLQRLRHSCPKCGAGVFLAIHANRTSCGNCGYTEFKK